MSGLEIIVDNRSGADIDSQAAVLLAKKALRLQGIDNGELGITYVNESEMSRINAEYMHRDGPTDVITLPIDAGENGDGELMPLLLGDILICPDVASAQAEGEGTTFQQELCLLLLHGILHLAGYDHERDDGEMDVLQNQLVYELCPADGGTGRQPGTNG